MAWLDTAGGYQVTLESGEVACRNAAGRRLKSVPPALREDPVVVGLRQLTEWLARHDGTGRARTWRGWCARCRYPRPLLRPVWPDEVWRTALTDLVVAVPDDDGTCEPDQVGFLRDVTAEGIGIVNLDGETVRRAATGSRSRTPCSWPTWSTCGSSPPTWACANPSTSSSARPGPARATSTRRPASISEYSGGKFEELRHLKARATSLGYQVRGGYAVCRVFESGRTVETRSWVGADDPYYETETGDLVFVERDGSGIPLVEVGPVAWSEGMRMAAALYAGRVVESSEEEAA